MIVARHYVIGGRVQNVGFRYYTLEAASREGLSGSVRNRRDGQVEIDVEGDLEAVIRFERAVRQGPPGARVDDVRVEERPPSGRMTGFMVR